MRANGWTRREMMAVAAAHLIEDGETVLVGLGLPQIATLLAKHTHAPNATLMLENGVFDLSPSGPSMGVADPTLWDGATAFGGMLDALGYALHGGRVTLGVLGALQVDRFGSVNSSLVVLPDGTPRRFAGSGGANDIASLAKRIVVVMQHDERKFRETLDFVTSPGRRPNGRSREAAGLRGLGTVAVVTDRAVLEVGDNGLSFASVHPGEDVAAIRMATPVPIEVPHVTETQSPTAEQLSLIRKQLDPYGWYTS